LFFGGSFTFGEGVAAGETLPCAFQALSAGEFRAYNYGKSAFGPGQLYWILKTGEFMDSGIQPEGIAVYSFISDHVPRTVGELSKITSGGLYMDYPYFKLDEVDGSLDPFYLSDNPEMKSWLGGIRTLRALYPTARYFLSHLELPLLSREEAIQVTAEVIIEASRMYAARYDGDFFVVIWPRDRLDPESQAAFIALLQEAGITVLDVPPLPGGQSAQLHEKDPHPSAAEYRWVAEQLWQAVGSGRE
jgi:hypothetical protein